MELAPETELKLALARLNASINDNASSEPSVFGPSKTRLNRPLKAMILAPILPAFLASLPYFFTAIWGLFIGIISASQQTTQIINTTGVDIVFGMMVFGIALMVIFAATVFILFPFHCLLKMTENAHYVAYIFAGIVAGFMAALIFFATGKSFNEAPALFNDPHTQMLITFSALIGGVLGANFRYLIEENKID